MSVKQAPRKRIAGDRKKGVVSDWKGTWGWIKPSTPLKHAEAQKNNGKIYLNSKEMRAGIAVGKDMKVEFFVYSGARGLGAEDVTKVGGGGDANSDDDEADGALPLGWSKEWDEEQKEWYYWNKLARTASWEKPKAKAAMKRARPMSTPEEEEEEAPVAAARVDGLILGQHRMSGIVTQWEGSTGWISPLMADVPVDLKALLARSQDKVYLNWREVKDGLKLKVGSHVDFNIFADNNGLAASDVTAHQAGRGRGGSAGEKAVQKLQGEWANQDGKKAKFARKPASTNKNYGLAEASAGDDADGELLPGWEQCWSEEHHMNFYWHKASKSSSWERPAVPDDGESIGTRRAPPMPKTNVAEERRVTSRVATPLTPLISKAGRIMTPNTPTAAAVRTGQGQPTKRTRTN